MDMRFKRADCQGGILKTVFHLYPVLPQKLHTNVQQSHVSAKFYLFLRAEQVLNKNFVKESGGFFRKWFLFVSARGEDKKDPL